MKQNILYTLSLVLASNTGLLPPSSLTPRTMLFFKCAPLRVPTARDEDTTKVHDIVGMFIQSERIFKKCR